MEAEEKNNNRPFNAPASLFTNNVAVGSTMSEIVISFGVAGVPSQLLYLSLPVAKSLSRLLDDALVGYEKKTGTTIFSVEDLVSKEKEITEANKQSDDAK